MINTLQATTPSDRSDAQAPRRMRVAEIDQVPGSVPPRQHGAPVRGTSGHGRSWPPGPVLRLDARRGIGPQRDGAEGVIALKRAGVIVTLGALLSIFGGMVTASPALARGDGWQIQPAPPAIIVPATFCGFEIQVTFPVDREFAKILTASDGFMTTLVTGSLVASLTNLQTGKTVTENISGPSKETVNPDGSMTTTATGLNPIALTAADAARFGLPTFGVTAGARAVSIAPDGSITALTLQGHVLVDVCAALN